MLWIQQWSMPISAACHENRTIFQRIRSLRESEKAIKLASMSASTKYIQPGYSTVTPYLYAKPDLADFLKNAFGAELTHPPTPDAAGQFHSEATVGGAHVLFGNGFFSDPSMAAAVYIYVPDVDAPYKRAVISVNDPILHRHWRFHPDVAAFVRAGFGVARDDVALALAGILALAVVRLGLARALPFARIRAET